MLELLGAVEVTPSWLDWVRDLWSGPIVSGVWRHPRHTILNVVRPCVTAAIGFVTSLFDCGFVEQSMRSKTSLLSSSASHKHFHNIA